MQDLRITCRLLAATLLLTSVGVAATEVGDYSGEENYQRLCAACHGSTGHGDGPVAEVLSKPVPDLTLIRTRNGGQFPREDLVRQIDGRDRIDAHGSQQMPVWGYEFWIEEGAGRFSDERVQVTLNELVDYLESIQRED